MRKVIFSNWNYVRAVRLLIALAILAEAIHARDILFGIAGVLFMLLVIFNMGCCSAGSCNISVKKSSEKPAGNT